MSSPNLESFRFEVKMEQKLRKQAWLIPVITFFIGSILFVSLGLLMELFNQGFYWVIFFSGMIGHAFFIVVIHDGAHKSITRTKWDRVIMNIGSGMMLLPFYAEPFRKFHLVHHANTNTDVDPLWPEVKKNLYTKHRYFYLLCTLIPLLFTLYLITSQQYRISKHKKTVKSPKINYLNILWSTVISVIIFVLVKPPILYLIGTLFFMNIFSVLRHCCEHLGYNNEHESNTFWFPLGMGIGNHDTHHVLPTISWITLWIGLFKREKTTSVFRAIYGLLFDSRFEHYISKKDSFDGSSTASK